MWHFLPVFLVSIAAGSDAHGADGTVPLPLSQWEAMLDEAAASPASPPPVPYLQVDRALQGAFSRGVFTGTLTARVVVPAGSAAVRVPVLDASTSIAAVQVDGRTTSLLPEGGFYTVALGAPGAHDVRVDFFVGREDDRFARHLALTLPPSGPTRLSVLVPEADIEAELAQGAVTGLRAEGGGTRVEGQLDGRGQLDLTWKGHAASTEVPLRLEAKEYALFTLHEALVRGVAVFDTTVLDGEADRLVLQVPPDVEIVDVLGDAVLQWDTEPGRLVVLLRYLVADRTSVRVQFQFPVDLAAPVTLRMPLPDTGVPFSGAIGVLGPAGLQAEVQSASGAEELRELPSELAALTSQPLILGFSFREAPSVALRVARQPEVEVISTVIDDLDATTVLIEDGAEITRMQLRVRNNTRQYLAAKLPEGAVLTSARIDGRPVRPAVLPAGAAGAEGGETLLFPLVRSERLGEDRTQTWTVEEGDTLGSIAGRFYSDPGLWSVLLDNNRDQLGSAMDLTPGQNLRIPPQAGAAAQESSFVLELAWTRSGGALGWLGRRALRLPELDADVMDATWHLHLPDAVLPLSFSGNLTAYSGIRYDHFRRVQQFLERMAWDRRAWAGLDNGPGYSSILLRRKSIYRQESGESAEGQEVSGTFPLVGDKYRFKRLLPGREVPELAVTWMAQELVPVARWGALFAALALARRALTGGRKGPTIAGFVALLVVGWYVGGVHRRLVWGLDLALLWTVLQGSAGFRAPEPRAILDRWSFAAVGRLLLGVILAYVLLAVPLAWSTILLAVLAWRVRRGA